MKHAIIPTDFSISSLQIVHDVMHHYSGEQVKITLLHLVFLPDSIPDLLFKRRQNRRDIPSEFTQACEIIANKYGASLAGIKTLIQAGETKAYMENLFDGLKADAVFIAADHAWVNPFQDSIQTMALCRKCRFPIVERAATSRADAKSFATIGDLLLVAND